MTTILQVVQISSTGVQTLLNSSLSFGTAVTAAGSGLCYRRWRYCDGIIQMLLAETTKTSLVTVRSNDLDPAELTVVSIVVMPATPIVSLTTMVQYLSTPNGCFVLANTDGNNASLQVFGPPPATPQKYINTKPMYLTSSIAASGASNSPSPPLFTNAAGTFTIAAATATNLRINTLVALIQNFTEIAEVGLVQGANTWFSPRPVGSGLLTTGKILAELMLSVTFSYNLSTATPASVLLQIPGLTPSTNMTLSSYHPTSTTLKLQTIHLNTQQVFSAASLLTITITSDIALTLTGGTLTLKFLRYV